MDTAVIIAIISIIGNIILALFQFRQNVAKAKRDEIEAAAILIDKALIINKDEIESLNRTIETLEHEIEHLNAILVDKDNKIKELKEELDEIRNRYKPLEG